MLTTATFGPVTRIHLQGTLRSRPTYAVSAYLLRDTLIDTGMPRTGPLLAGWLSGRPLARILLSHHHEDHIGGASYLSGRGAPIFAPAAGLDRIAHPRRIPFYRRLAFGQPRGVAAEPLPDVVETGAHRLEVIETPGHAPDHVVFLDPETGWLFGADLFVEARGKFLRRQDDLQTWYDSIQRVLARDFGTLFCAHAGIILDGRAALRDKIAFWEEMAGEARHLAGQGLPDREIRQRLLGAEKYLTFWSLGTYSKINLVRALRRLQPRETPVEIG